MSGRFALRVPFEPLQVVTDMDGTRTWRTGPWHITLRAELPYLVLRVEPFGSEDEAAAFFPQVWAALAWMAVQSGLGFRVEEEFDRIVSADDPQAWGDNARRSLGVPMSGPIDGIANGNVPVALPLGKVIRFMTALPGQVTISHRMDRIQPFLEEGFRLASESTYRDERYRTAVELLCDEGREQSLRSRLLTLVTALEVIAPRGAKHPVALSILDDMQARVTAAKDEHEMSSEAWASLDALQRELVFRRDASFRSRLRQLVLQHTTHLEPAQQQTRVREILWAYDQRSLLIHKGGLESPALSRAYSIARRELGDALSARLAPREEEQ